MFKILSSVAIVLLLNVSLKAQDTVRLVHKEYTSVFSKSLKYPVLVEWWVTKQKVSCANPIPRKDRFQPDPLLAAETNLEMDYKGSGTDRGHMAPAADNQCSENIAMIECFYFSNMAPQYHSLNAGDWKTLETNTRDLAKAQDSIKVWCGNIGVAKKIGKVSVPTKCWKVIYVKKTNEWKAYIFNNDTSKPNGLSDNLVKVEDIEKLTNFKFKID
jgi:endonuclease G